MGTMTLSGAYVSRVVDGAVRVVPYAPVTYYNAPVGGSAYTVVTDLAGDDSRWPGGTGRADSDGWAPEVLVDYGLSDSPGGAYLDSPEMCRRVWVSSHEAGSGGGGGDGEGETLTITRYLALGPGPARFRSHPTTGKLQWTTAEDGTGWTDVDTTGGGGGGADPNAIVGCLYDATAGGWKTFSGGAVLTARPAVWGSRVAIFLSATSGVSVPAWAASQDRALIAT